jgi:hypothetical protein
MPLETGLQVRLFDNNLASPSLIADLTDRINKLQFSTELNGGFKFCQFVLAQGFDESWQWLSREGKAGYHFYRLTVYEGHSLIWEGRITEIALSVTGREKGLRVKAFGYWAATRDQLYSDNDHTDWTSGSGHEIDDIVKEMLTQECPDINSDQSNIAAGTRDLAGIDLSAYNYPQFYINELTKVSDDDGGAWFFAIWNDRKPYLFKRNVTNVDWIVYLENVHNLTLNQSAATLRNAVTPVVSGTAGTTVTDTSSLALYPRRELRVDLQAGANANTQANAATAAVTEKALPRQSQGFQIRGTIYASTATATGGRFEEAPLWRVRAGDVLRIQDLVPSSAATPALDDVRTFYVMGTNYNADTNILNIQPDRRHKRITSAINKLGNTEG